MAHTDIAKCNQALDRERNVKEKWERHIENEIETMRREAQEISLKADGMEQALQAFRNLRRQELGI